MAFADSKNNPLLADKEPNCSPENDWRVWTECPNLKEVEDGNMNGEWYKCEKCGRLEFADYDEMR